MLWFHGAFAILGLAQVALKSRNYGDSNARIAPSGSLTKKNNPQNELPREARANAKFFIDDDDDEDYFDHSYRGRKKSYDSSHSSSGGVHFISVPSSSDSSINFFDPLNSLLLFTIALLQLATLLAVLNLPAAISTAISSELSTLLTQITDALNATLGGITTALGTVTTAVTDIVNSLGGLTTLITDLTNLLNNLNLGGIIGRNTISSHKNILSNQFDIGKNVNSVDRHEHDDNDRFYQEEDKGTNLPDSYDGKGVNNINQIITKLIDSKHNLSVSTSNYNNQHWLPIK